MSGEYEYPPSSTWTSTGEEEPVPLEVVEIVTQPAPEPAPEPTAEEILDELKTDTPAPEKRPKGLARGWTDKLKNPRSRGFE